MLQIPENSVLPQSVKVVVQKGNHCQAKRYRDLCGRRFKAGYYPNQVAEQNEDKDCCQQRNKSVVMVADNVCAGAAHKLVQQLHGVLQGSWLLHRKARADEKEKRDQDRHHQHFHGNRVGDGRLRVRRMKRVRQFLQKRVYRPAQGLVEERSKPELFVHSLFIKNKCTGSDTCQGTSLLVPDPSSLGSSNELRGNFSSLPKASAQLRFWSGAL